MSLKKPICIARLDNGDEVEYIGSGVIASIGGAPQPPLYRSCFYKYKEK